MRSDLPEHSDNPDAPDPDEPSGSVASDPAASDPAASDPVASDAAIGRRRFIGVVAASGAAILASRLARAESAPAKPARPPSAKPSRTIPEAVERELRNQEKSVADTLKVIRAYELPTGSEPATVFRAMRARRGGR